LANCEIWIEVAVTTAQIVLIFNTDDEIIASGSSNSAGTITINEHLGSGISGSVEWDGVGTVAIAPKTELTCKSISSSSSI